MKAFLIAMVALVMISFGSNWALNEIGFSASDTTVSGPSVRLDD